MVRDKVKDSHVTTSVSHTEDRRTSSIRSGVEEVVGRSPVVGVCHHERASRTIPYFRRDSANRRPHTQRRHSSPGELLPLVWNK